MNILVIGSGGREHAIIKKLKKDGRTIYAAPGNGGISKDAICIDIKPMELVKMSNFAVQNKIDFAIVAPDDPLVLGMVDELNNAGIKTFGPKKNAAAIEGSKVFAKNLMKKYNIPTADYQIFYTAIDALSYVQRNNNYPMVIKADGLALGKGVIIAQNSEEATEAINAIMEDKIFGDSGKKIVIEEFLTGKEISLLCFTDGETIVPMVSSMDYKRAYNNSQGENTGGMGTLAPSPLYTKEIADECMNNILIPTIKALKEEGRTFTGCLYAGLILTNDGVKVIEFNCRFGDPETQVVLPLLESDLLEIMMATNNESLHELDIKWSDKACVCVILASGGYPKSYKTGYTIDGLNKNGALDNVTVYHAGTKFNNNEFLTNGGRVLGITAIADKLELAIQKAYAAVPQITFKDVQYRTDIGTF